MAKRKPFVPPTSIDEWCEKVVEWMEGMAERDDADAKAYADRLPAFAEGCVRSAKNFRAMIGHYRKIRAKQQGDAK